MVDSNDSFLREVKEEIDRERLENIWKQYGGLIVGAAALILVTVLAVQFWNWSVRQQEEKAGLAYQNALDLVYDKKLDKAVPAFEEIEKDAPAGYAALADLQLAASLLEEGKTAEAQAKYEELAKNSSADALFTGFAQLQAAALQLGKADFTEMENRLNDLIKDENPWRFNAMELLGAAAVGTKQYAKARELFEKILTAENTPPAMRQRANLQMAQIVILESGGETPASAPAPAKDDKSAGDTATTKGPQPAKAEDSKPEDSKPEENKAEDTKTEGATEPGNSTSQ